MGLYNFQERFVPFILNGRKQHTIRAARVHDDEPGDLLHLYSGLRTKKARLLMRRHCVRVESIHIFSPDVIFVGEQALSVDEREALAVADGFRDFADMMKFWIEPINRLPFDGHIIHWRFHEKCPTNSN
jgi:hypothetical protein